MKGIIAALACAAIATPAAAQMDFRRLMEARRAGQEARMRDDQIRAEQAERERDDQLHRSRAAAFDQLRAGNCKGAIDLALSTQDLAFARDVKAFCETERQTPTP